MRRGGRDLGGLVARKDLEGERSPGRTGRLPAGNGRVGVTDSMAEQRLEVDARGPTERKDRFWQRSRLGAPRRVGGNGKEATATATWCGCRRGESFGGCEHRRGEGLFGRETRRTPGLAAGCNKPATSERRKPSRWRETTRAERDFEGGSLGTEARAERCVWEWTLGGMSVEGESDRIRPVRRTKSHERRSVIRPGRRVSTLEGSQGPRVRSIPRSSRIEGVGGAPSEDLEGPPGNR
jgi:hypothetical protein